MEIQEEKIHESLQANNSQPPAVVPGRVLTAAIVVSIISGLVGGVAGAAFVLPKIPAYQKFFANQSAVSGPGVTYVEKSDVIDVVKQASPAVVSVVISKDLSKIPGYGLDPFNDPFFNFFGGRQQQQQTTPNVQEVGAGSGFFISADGLIVTNKHVVEDEQASYTVLTQDGKKYDAQVLSRDPVNDLAIIKIDTKNAPFLNFADSSTIQIGQRVVAIGNSLGQYQNTVTTGVVSGIGRSITAGGESGSENLSGVIQTDAAINPGNSGGPLLNLAGQVIGINTAIDQQGQLVGFAIPANDITKAVASFKKSGKITRPYLGVRYVPITKDLAQSQNLPRDYGALVIRGQTMNDLAVIPGSPADKAGLTENDIILEVNGKKIDENNTLSNMLKDYNVGDTVTLKVYDKGNEKDVKVTLGETK